jgi:hypothetical protein
MLNIVGAPGKVLCKMPKRIVRDDPSARAVDYPNDAPMSIIVNRVEVEYFYIARYSFYRQTLPYSGSRLPCTFAGRI